MEKIILFVKRKKKIVFRFEWKKKKGKKKGGVSDSRLDVRKRGGGHSDAYCVQQGWWGGLKFRKTCVCNYAMEGP